MHIEIKKIVNILNCANYVNDNLNDRAHTCGRGGGTGVAIPHGSGFTSGGLEIEVAPSEMSSKSIKWLCFGFGGSSDFLRIQNDFSFNNLHNN